MSYTTKDIRNVCLLGHGGSGKTTLTENMLYLTGAIDRQGKVNDGNTVCDYDAEEIKRQVTISAAIAPISFGGKKINVIDCPGFQDFAGEVAAALRAVEAGIIFCTAKDGLSVGAERNWKLLKAAGKPVAFYVSKLDEEHGDYFGVLEALQAKYGSIVCPVTIPASDGIGVIDLVHNIAYETNGSKTAKVAVPAADAGKAEELREALMETAAGATEELMEKYFEEMTLSEEELVTGIKAGLKDRSVVPVFCGVGTTGVGTQALLQAILDYVPAPDEVEGIDPNGPTAGLVFKTVSDQFGKYNFIKLVSGKLTADMSLRNSRTGNTDKLGRLYTMCGKKTTEVKVLNCGDIGVVSKLASVKTGDTLCVPARPLTLKPAEYHEPCHSRAIYAKVKGQEEKIASGLTRLAEEDLSFKLVNNAETKEMVLTGAGDIHLDVLCSKLRSKFGVESELREPKVAYRETIRKSATVRGRHKKQSGGHGQFGDVVIEFSPGETQELTFEEKVVGGAVPKNFFPAVEKGLRESCEKGVLAGYPMVFVKATLLDGSYHPVDSSEMAFKMAASLAYKEGIPQAGPVILEPIGSLKVTIPDSMMGDIMGDLNKRRGRIMGMTPDDDGNQVVEAEVPMSEMMSYAIDLRSMTQGSGSFTFAFVRYEEAPATTQQAIIEAAKKSGNVD